MILRSLLLMTAIGYFFVATHTHEHHGLHTAHHAHEAFHGHEAEHPHHHHTKKEDTSYEDHECPICTVQSLFILFAPTHDVTPDIPHFNVKISSVTSETMERDIIASSLHARAPPAV